MSNFKEKAQVFIIGLSIGLLIAGTFFILKLDDYFKELNLYKKVSQTFSLPPKNEKGVNNGDAESETEKKSIVKNGKKTTLKIDTSEITNKKSNLQIDADTLKFSKSDSANSQFNNANDIVVRKDELLSVRTIEITNLNPNTNKSSAKDSLLSRVSGIKEDKVSGMFNVELWQSPLNYKGYKLSKYKMVLYGIPSFDELKLYRLDDVIYLKSSSLVYRLDYVSDFKQYERITDENIINKLK